MKAKLWIAALVVVTFVVGTGVTMWLVRGRTLPGPGGSGETVVELLKKPVPVPEFTVTDIEG